MLRVTFNPFTFTVALRFSVDSRLQKEVDSLNDQASWPIPRGP